ncbi:caspase family protein [Nostoc sp.]|uniref:caspase family protein n=1 Tax=Nostoc sp. TaxID=1180 RepID=UPI003FA5D9FE
MAKVALLIGVSEYEPGLNSLPGAVKDVEAMQRVLVNPEMGGFAMADITVLKNSQRQEIEDAIYHLFSNRQKDDLLLFYGYLKSLIYYCFFLILGKLTICGKLVEKLKYFSTR